MSENASGDTLSVPCSQAGSQLLSGVCIAAVFLHMHCEVLRCT